MFDACLSMNICINVVAGKPKCTLDIVLACCSMLIFERFDNELYFHSQDGTTNVPVLAVVAAVCPAQHPQPEAAGVDE